MAEFICTYMPDNWGEKYRPHLGEEIVRCRDCVYYDITGEEYRFYSDKVYCEKLWKYVEPDGFCAWAERKESGE